MSHDDLHSSYSFEIWEPDIMSKKRKLESEDDEDDKLPPVKKRKVAIKKEIKMQPLKSVYVVMRRKGDEATKRYEENMVDSYDKEIIAIYADKTKANAMARKYFDEMHENGEIEGEVWETYRKNVNGLFKGQHHANNMGWSKYGAQLTNHYVWVQKNTVLH